MRLAISTTEILTDLTTDLVIANNNNNNHTLKKELERASLNPIDESLPFVVECDASEVACF